MIEEISEIVKEHFPYDAMFVEKLPRKRNGVRLARIKFASYNTDSWEHRMKSVEDVTLSLAISGVPFEDINGHRSVGMFDKKNYDSLFIFIIHGVV